MLLLLSLPVLSRLSPDRAYSPDSEGRRKTGAGITGTTAPLTLTLQDFSHLNSSLTTFD